MADTMRSIAVLVAAGISYIFHVDPALVDATAAVVVSVIIALSLGPLIIGLFQTWNELKALKRDQQKSNEGKVHIPWMEQYQNLPSVSPRIGRRR
jgi:Co/Zn/Cd efflux system component